ncbi:hypothetical protein HJC23_010385 [Cyclotella cryptica]|uniref:Plus3 domain-containing protein n=1 Tax=Cyclotella cryptica TaxID=29204 RepID=A0ABD3QH73_9STRA|eukprot:CCRYP_005237-RA/>CCRYP_005237-RA protein AED:0.05 eAED:0.05 QI:333/1/1/1/1/1/7/2031/965
MVRTKKHFRPPSPSSSSSSSGEEEEETQQAAQTVQRGMGKQFHFGGGKQLSVMGGGFRGGGKQLRMAPQEDSEEDSDDDDDDDDDDEEEAPSTTITTSYNRGGGGKQLRVPGGKQLRAAPADEEEDDSDDDSEEEEEEEVKQPVYRPAGGKQFGGKAFAVRSMGKQLVRPPTPEMDDDDDSDSDDSEEEEEEALPPTTTVVQVGHRGGKQLRIPSPPEDANKEESADDMEESDEEEEEDEEEAVEEEKAPEPPPAPKPEPVPEPEPQPEPPQEESDEEEIKPAKRRGRPPASSPSRPTRSTRSTKTVVDESSESESDSDEEFELDMETFDTQKLVQDEEDKKRLDSMPELEREAILAERFEKLKSEADMKKALRENKRREKEQKKMTRGKAEKAPAKKRSSPKKEPPKKRGRKEKKTEETKSDEDEDYEEEVPDTSGDAALAESMSGKRVSTRNLDAKGNKFKRAAALAKIRENRASKAPSGKDESESDLDYGRDSDDSDDDYEESTMLKPWQQKGRKTTQLEQESSDEESVDEKREKDASIKRKGDDIDADVEDFVLVAIPRRRLIRWCNEPFFEDAVKNFYVRLGIGRDNKTQKACYRLCKIVGVETKAEYSFPPEPNQKPVSTNKWLRVTFGKFENVFKMITVSDHRPTPDDVTKYVSQLKTDRQSDSILSKKKAIKLRKKQDNLVNNYTYTKEDIEKLVTEKKKRNMKASNIGLEKTRIAIAVQAAKDSVKEAERRLEEAKIEQMEADDSMVGIAQSNVTKAKEALEDANALLQERLEEQKRVLKDEEDRINRLKGSSKVQNWVKVNQRARLANQNADFQSYREQLAKEKAEASAEPKFDPFARRKVKPKNLWEVGTKQSSDKTPDANSNGALEEEKKDIHPSERDDANAGKDADKDSKREDATETQKLDASGQSAPFVYDDDINIGDIANLGLGMKKLNNRARRGISLEDYQNRKAAGTL